MKESPDNLQECCSEEYQSKAVAINQKATQKSTPRPSKPGDAVNARPTSSCRLHIFFSVISPF